MKPNFLTLAPGFTYTQEDAYPVGLPPFTPAPTNLELVEHRANRALVRHVEGEIEVPKNPNRVVATNPAALEMLLSLDLKPSGSLTLGEHLGRLRSQLDGVTLLPVEDGVNVEARA